MGGEAHTSDSFMYLTVTKGKMVNKKRNIEWDKYTGYIVGIEIKDGEFEGKPTKKVEVKMKDDQSDEVVNIQFTLAAYFARGFFARIYKIDVSKPFTLCVTQSDQNEKSSFCWMKQGGQKYKNAQGKEVEAIEPHATFPKPEDIDLGSGQKTLSWAKVIPSMEKTLAFMQKQIAEKGIKLPPKPTASVSTPPVDDFSPESVIQEEKRKYEDDLPF